MSRSRYAQEMVEHAESVPEHEQAEGAIMSNRLWLPIAAAFFIICLFLLFDELLDLPHLLFRVPPTPVNWSEALIEVALVAVVGIFSVKRLIHVIAEREQTERALREAQEKITRAAQEILEMSIPIVPVLDGILALPIIGTLDSQRAQQIGENLLQAIVDSQAKVVITDITGVPIVDTLVATHLLKTASAVRLLGASVILTGVSPDIAQTMVTLGVELTGMNTQARLIDGVNLALKMLNKKVVEIRPE